jgi:hypothetical protein
MGSSAVVRSLAAFFAATLLAGCVSVSVSGCPAGQPIVSDTLYFGASNPDAAVNEAEWSDFLSVAVTPRFPDGFTSWPAGGQWKSSDGTILRERSHVLSIVHPPGATADAAIRGIIDEYKLRFHQESVLRVSSNACATF